MIEQISAYFRRRKTLSQSLPTPEGKSSATQSLIAMHLTQRPVWSARDLKTMIMEGFMKNPVAYRCVRMVAEASASVPIRVEHKGQLSLDHPLKQLIDNPNLEQSGEALREALYASLQTSGNAYIEAVTGDDGQRPKELWALRSDRVKVVPSRSGWPEAYEYSVNGAATRIGRDPDAWLKIAHLKLWHPLDDWYGLSPLEAAGFAIDIHNASGQWNKALLDNAARPSGALIYGANGSDRLSEDQFDRLKQQLTQTYAGGHNAGRPLLLEGGLDWKPMSHSPSEMDFIEGKYAAARDIALCFGVPSQLLGIPGDNSFANYKEANQAFWRHTIVPLVEKTTRHLSQWLEPKFDGARLLTDLEAVPALSVEREALWSRIDQASFLSEAERRRFVNLNPNKEGA